MTQPVQSPEELVHAHWREVLSMLTVITRNPATAQDLAQEVFLLAFQKRPPPGPHMRAWLREVARRLAMNELRRKRPASVDPAVLQQIAESAPTADDALPDPRFDDRLVALRLCMSELDRDDRELLAAKYERRNPLENIAAGTGQSIGYIKQRLFRLRKRLEKCVLNRLAAEA